MWARHHHPTFISEFLLSHPYTFSYNYLLLFRQLLYSSSSEETRAEHCWTFWVCSPGSLWRWASWLVPFVCQLPWTKLSDHWIYTVGCKAGTLAWSFILEHTQHTPSLVTVHQKQSFLPFWIFYQFLKFELFCWVNRFKVGCLSKESQVWCILQYL